MQHFQMTPRPHMPGHWPYFRYSARGWSRSDRDSCAASEYVPWNMQATHERPAQCPLQADKAAAARAVACVKLVK